MSENILELIGQPEGIKLEYKAVLPPSRTMAQIVAAFANAQGGTLILGVREIKNTVQITGLSEDFNAQAILAKALKLITPVPVTHSGYMLHEEKRLFYISVEQSPEQVLIEGKLYKRQDALNILLNPLTNNFNSSTYSRITQTDASLKQAQVNCTTALSKFIDHYSGVLNIVADLSGLLYPLNPSIKTASKEGKILFRILFSSIADTFEMYLSDLLYEVYLANPNTLKSDSQVTVKEVLDCNDIQEFIGYYAKKKISKLQRGSVKGFISGNEQISSLGAVSKSQQEDLEKILQIRHLYAHKNGFVDEKFLNYFPGEEYQLNDSHELNLDQFLDYMAYMSETVIRIDGLALEIHDLASV